MMDIHTTKPIMQQVHSIAILITEMRLFSKDYVYVYEVKSTVNVSILSCDMNQSLISF